MKHRNQDDEKAGAAAEAAEILQPCKRVGSSFTLEEITEAERRANSNGPWYTTRQVLEFLSSLHH